jgi:integrase
MKFQNKLINLGHSSSDINNKRAAISSLNNYIALFYEDDLPTFKNFIARGMPRPESQLVNKKEPPTKDEMALLIKTMEDRGDWQKAAYLRYTFDTGCRRAESIQLLKEVVNYKPIIKEKEIFNPDGSKSTVTVKYYQSNETRCKGRGKTGKVRRLVFGEETMQAIKKWLEMRGDDDCPYVFAYRRGENVQQITQTTLNRWASNVFTPILGRRFHPHILREARATSIVVEEGKSLEAAQKLLGHNSSDTTKIYVVRDDEDEEIDELYSI